jgi:hypothetical protein
VEADEVGRMTGLFPWCAGGTWGVHGDDGPCPLNGWGRTIWGPPYSPWGKSYAYHDGPHNPDIPWSHQQSIVSLEWSSMVPCGKTGEYPEIGAAKGGNYALGVVVVDEIDTRVARIDCLWSVYFQHYYLMFQHCLLGMVLTETAHRLTPYWLSSAEIHSLTSYVNKRW